MQLLASVFSGSGGAILNAVLALCIVLALIVLGLWGLKLLSNATRSATRGRNRRLMLVDALPIDAKRQLLIIRRDNVEHLLLTGGPQDMVIESGIAIDPPTGRTLPTHRNALAVGPRTGQQMPQRPTKAAAIARDNAAMLAREMAPPAVPPHSRTIAEAGTGATEINEPVSKNPFARVRALGRTTRPSSIRHTGLLRPAGRVEPALVPANTDNSDQPGPDSARTAGVAPAGESHEDDGNGRNASENGDTDGYREDGR